MPLDKSLLQTELDDVYSKNSPPALVANGVAKALVNYWNMGTAGTDGIITAAPAQSLISSGLNGVWSSFQPGPSVAASQIATQITSGFMTIAISGPTFGTGNVIFADQAGLQVALNDIFSSNPPSSKIFANKFATAIDNYTKAAIVFGTGVPTTFPPVPSASIT